MAGLGRNREVERERMVLERIVALLLALAGLAERAVDASSRRRRQALEFLARGEAEACRQWQRVYPPRPTTPGASPRRSACWTCRFTSCWRRRAVPALSCRPSSGPR